MQLSYIKRLSEAYVIDNRLFEGVNAVTADDLAENFYNAIKSLRLENPDIYESFIGTNKFAQKNIFKTYFDMVYLEDVNPYQNEDVEVLQEDGVLTAIGSLVAAVGKVVYAVGSTIFSPYSIIVFSILLFSPALRRGIAKATISTAIGILSALGYAGRIASRASDRFRLAYSIIHNNANECLKECDYDPARSRATHYLFQFQQGNPIRNIARMFFSIDSEKKLECLRECFVKTLKDSTKIAADLYFQCLRNTGDFSKLPLEKDFSAFQTIIAKTQISTSCSEFMDVVDKSFSSVNTALSIIYHEEPHKQRMHKVELMNDIYNMQRKTQTERPNTQNNRPQNFNRR